MAPAITALADSFSSLYSNSPVLRTAVGFAHLGGLVGGGGCAIAADRALLQSFRRSAADRAQQLQALHGVHRAVLVGLTVVLVSGAMLAFADLDAYWSARVFWIKMGFVVALMANGAVLTHASTRARRGEAAAWPILRRTCILSLLLWFTTTLVGAALPNAL